MGETKRILIVDDHPLICKGLALMITKKAPDIQVCGDADDVNSALETAASQRPDLMVIDIELKSSNGLDLVKALRTRHPDIPTLVFSMHDESIYAERALRAGARGYVMKDLPVEKLVEAIRKVLAGKLYFSEDVTMKILGKFVNVGHEEYEIPLNRLSNRELEIFQLIGQELKSGNIAKKLNISIKTVEAHRDNIRKKLLLTSNDDLNRFAREWSSHGHPVPPPML
ncbi:MAG TPA: response regulator transcription factor [Spirochaetota bacterium]|nr:response regulator transcription factor [Spirochaetota bacterium]HPC41582.1 response regulator transcription factor [Spirochaetota bacterium]HPL15400.1 response regulator transcription factor [Spirochaetota bacterium]HRS76889.1 response regulator transcription factor [Spirochaetota bacterium]HRT74457.1 response regulator transcription factor [Spirochaetota bacterium]